MKIKRIKAIAILVVVCLCLCSCSAAPRAEQLDKKIFDFFTERGLSCERANDAVIENPAIYDESVWYALNVNGEAVYVYFDESNRADYLSSGIDQGLYGYSTAFGLRYVLNYRGSDGKVLDALEAMAE